MKLSDFLAALRTNNVTVTINDLQDKLVCKIDAASYSALSDDLENRTINRWNIVGATSIMVVLNDPDNSNSDSGNNNSGSDTGNDSGNDPSDP